MAERTQNDPENAQLDQEFPEYREIAEQNVPKYVIASMGIALIPVPLIDSVALSLLQLNMLHKLSGIYKVPFVQDRGKHIIATLASFVIPVPAARGMTSLLKTIPIIGPTTALLALPMTCGALTYATAKIFIQHFESGGTFLSFDPNKVKAYYQKIYQEGLQKARNFSIAKNI